MRGAKMRHVERRARRMHEMMEVLGVDAGRLARLDQGEAYAQARLRCLNCSEAGRCLEWLEHAVPHSAGPEFCGNVDLFKWAATDMK